MSYNYSSIQSAIHTVAHIATFSITRLEHAWRTVILLPSLRFVHNWVVIALTSVWSILISSIKYLEYSIYHILRYIIRSLLVITNRLIIKPLRIYITVFTKFVLLPINVPLKIVLGVSLEKLAKSSQHFISNYIIVTLFQYSVTLTILALSIGGVLGIMLAWSNNTLVVPDLIIDFNKLLYIDEIVSYLRSMLTQHRLQMALFNEFADMVCPASEEKHDGKETTNFTTNTPIDSENISVPMTPPRKIRISGQETPGYYNLKHKQVPSDSLVDQTMAYLTPVNSRSNSIEEELEVTSSDDQWAECTSAYSEGRTLRVTVGQTQKEDWKLHSDFELRDDDDFSSATLLSKRRKKDV